ncbi:Dfp1/Him1, central region-domain-containing protein [Boeremia exigua]|uniref:Dfp1/Him1, central region-domain-containing protein n=1 Tax=Boeremia exigua TaxID=749465 RepID=UPI001E8E8EE1|nr:Dfp1/Him1, central region-domain-containing protein [Boeremia exigua]KAH6633353.1 Dfp1/Him1, central region-domain-containing protein [Boeremia exigua]
MANRRVPLASLQNATNSPIRAPVAGGKRQRSHASEQRDMTYGQPPQKKQMIEVDDAEARRHGLVRRSNAPTTALTRKLEAARENKPPPKQAEKAQRVTNDLETIRQWQRHYRKLFPQFIFYFDSVQEPQKDKLMSRARILGSNEVTFFSRETTHVITTRPIPAELDTSSSSLAKGTVNPAQLENKKSVFDTALSKSCTGRPDILIKARELGMKIWSVEKLQRMIDTMFSKETGEDIQYTTRYSTATGQKGRQADLQRLLQNEKLDRDYVIGAQDMVQLRGYYVYVHDMDEVTRPVMIREYQKVEKEKGKWPQFRASGNGKCPFVEDPHFGRRQQEEHDERRAQRALAAAPRTRAASAMEERRALGENNNLARRETAPAVTRKEGQEDDAKPLDPPKGPPLKRTSTEGPPPMFGSAQASIRAMPRFIGGEPVASGLHQSNMTSAIQSQMISSTAAAPRAGNSKEVNQLQRKVLEKNSVTSANSAYSSVMNDVRGPPNPDHAQPMRAAKRKAQESLNQAQEIAEQERQARKMAALRRRKTAEKELKPGYCENCREKFNDFDEHCVTRKHRKFAVTNENWVELDALLAQLDRQ